MNIENVIASMMTENTGTHFLDSGGAYGRNWQRNKGLTVDALKAMPSATLEVSIREWSGRPHADGPVEYVTWIQNKDDVSRGHDGTYHGHYVPEYDMALDDFLNRQ